jgi:UDP-N-acetyl-D-galactosamine dehydrogenase
VDAVEAQHEYGLTLLREVEQGAYDAIVLAVGHGAFSEIGPGGIRAFGKPGAVVYDVKYVLPRDTVDGRL